MAKILLLSLIVATSACSVSTNPVIQTLHQAFGHGGSVADTHLDPNFRYLRVVIHRRAVFLALGNEDFDARGTIEVWYSAEREILRFQNGRLIGAAGTDVEWRGVSMPELPSWSALAKEQDFRWQRIRDVMPGYRYGVRDALVLRVIAPPANNELHGVDPNSLTWFEERADPARPGDEALPPARYAADLHDGNGVVIYGEQCLAADQCFTWQQWPASIQNSPDSR